MKKNILDGFDIDDTLRAFTVSLSRAVAKNPNLLLIIAQEHENIEWAKLANNLQDKTKRDYLVNAMNESAKLYDWGIVEETYRTWGRYGWIADCSMVPYGFWENRPLTPVDADALVVRALDKRKLTDLKIELYKKTNNYYIYNESIKCFDSRYYAACASLLISLIDSELIRCRCSLTTNNKKTGLKASERVVENILKDSDYGLPGFFHLELINYESCIKTLFAQAQGFDKEPKNLNRNFLHHGMSKRKVLRKDCIKLFLAYNQTIFITKHFESL